MTETDQVTLEKIRYSLRGVTVFFSEKLTKFTDLPDSKHHLKFQNCYSVRKLLDEISYLNIKDGFEIVIGDFEVEFSQPYLVKARPEVNWVTCNTKKTRRPGWVPSITFAEQLSEF